jgi:hypothetical protein
LGIEDGGALEDEIWLVGGLARFGHEMTSASGRHVVTPCRFMAERGHLVAELLWGMFDTCDDLKVSAGRSAGGNLVRVVRSSIRLSTY